MVSAKSDETFVQSLDEVVTFRTTLKEKMQMETVAKSVSIDISELMRNLVRDNIGKYAISKSLSKYLMISNQIDVILLEKRLISSRKVNNLSKMREILNDFEANIAVPKSELNYADMAEYYQQILKLINSIYEKDEWLAHQIDKQWYKISMHRHIKLLIDFKNL